MHLNTMLVLIRTDAHLTEIARAFKLLDRWCAREDKSIYLENPVSIRTHFDGQEAASPKALHNYYKWTTHTRQDTHDAQDQE